MSPGCRARAGAPEEVESAMGVVVSEEAVESVAGEATVEPGVGGSAVSARVVVGVGGSEVCVDGERAVRGLEVGAGVDVGLTRVVGVEVEAGLEPALPPQAPRPSASRTPARQAITAKVEDLYMCLISGWLLRYEQPVAYAALCHQSFRPLDEGQGQRQQIRPWIGTLQALQQP